MDQTASAPSATPTTEPVTSTSALTSTDAGAARLPAGKELWLVARTSPDADTTAWKSATDAMTAAAGLLWPLITIVALIFLRKQVRAAAVGLATRLADPNQALKLGPVELSKHVLALESQIETNKVENQVLASAVDSRVQRAAPETDASKQAEQTAAWEELCELAGKYQNVEMPDRVERVRAKDALAAQMASLVITRNIPRERLARDKDQGIRMALATVITTEPKPGDENWIALAGPGITLKHVRYRFMMAIGRLAESKLLSPARAQQFETLAAEYRENADESLLRRIQRTLLAIVPIAA